MPCFLPRLFALYSQNEIYPRAVTLLNSLIREAFPCVLFWTGLDCPAQYHPLLACARGTLRMQPPRAKDGF